MNLKNLTILELSEILSKKLNEWIPLYGVSGVLIHKDSHLGCMLTTDVNIKDENYLKICEIRRLINEIQEYNPSNLHSLFTRPIIQSESESGIFSSNLI